MPEPTVTSEGTPLEQTEEMICQAFTSLGWIMAGVAFGFALAIAVLLSTGAFGK